MKRLTPLVLIVVVFVAGCGGGSTDPLNVSLDEFAHQYAMLVPGAESAAQQVVDEIRNDETKAREWAGQMEAMCERMSSNGWDGAFSSLSEPGTAEAPGPTKETVEAYMKAATAPGSYCPELGN